MAVIHVNMATAALALLFSTTAHAALPTASSAAAPNWAPLNADAANAGPFTVVIDAGHGGGDTGTVHRLGRETITEKRITLEIARRLAFELTRRGVNVVLTRDRDHGVGLDERAAIANRAGGSLFLSLHVNSSPHDKDHGIETYVLNTTSNQSAQRLAAIENGRGHNTSNLALILSDLGTSANHKASVTLARGVQASLIKGMRRSGFPLRDRGVREALFYVLMQTQMPSVLVELGFASNRLELTRLTRGAYQNELSKTLTAAVLEYRRQWQMIETTTPERRVLLSVLRGH